jgi:hypothetical protein
MSHVAKIDLKEQAAKDAKLPPEDRHVINTIRMLAADMVKKANSGHPGMYQSATQLPTDSCQLDSGDR